MRNQKCKYLKFFKGSENQQLIYLVGMFLLKKFLQFPSIGFHNPSHLRHSITYLELFTLHSLLSLSLAMAWCYGCSHRTYYKTVVQNASIKKNSIIFFMFLFVCLTNIVCICSAKSLRTPSNVFVINLALCDFLMMSKTPIFIYNSFNHGYALGSAGCQVFAMVGALSGIGAAITNACIAYDR